MRESSYTSLRPKQILFVKAFPFHYPRQTTKPVPSLRYAHSSTVIQNLLHRHYFPDCVGLSIGNGPSAKFHRDFFSQVLTQRDLRVIHSVVELPTQHSRREFRKQTLCGWDDGKAIQSIDISPLQQPQHTYSHYQNSFTLILALQPLHLVIHTHTVPHLLGECLTGLDDWVYLRREYQA